jgi:hypothetical protein
LSVIVSTFRFCEARYDEAFGFPGRINGRLGVGPTCN